MASEDTAEVTLFGSDFETQAGCQLQGGGSGAGEMLSGVADPRFQAAPEHLLERVTQLHRETGSRPETSLGIATSRPKLLPGGLVAIPRQVGWCWAD